MVQEGRRLRLSDFDYSLVDGPLVRHLRREITDEEYLDLENQRRQEFGYPPLLQGFLSYPSESNETPGNEELPPNVIPFPIKPR